MKNIFHKHERSRKKNAMEGKKHAYETMIHAPKGTEKN